jgi:hypothetical protein
MMFPPESLTNIDLIEGAPTITASSFPLGLPGKVKPGNPSRQAQIASLSPKILPGGDFPQLQSGFFLIYDSGNSWLSLDEGIITLSEHLSWKTGSLLHCRVACLTRVSRENHGELTATTGSRVGLPPSGQSA